MNVVDTAVRKDKCVHLRLPGSVVEQIRQVAVRKGMYVATMLRVYILEKLQQEEK